MGKKTRNSPPVVLLCVLSSFCSQLATVNLLESSASSFMHSVYGFHLYSVGEPVRVYLLHMYMLGAIHIL